MARGSVERRGWRWAGGEAPTFRLPSPGALKGPWLPASALQRRRAWLRVRRTAFVRRPFALLAAALPDALAIVFLLAQVLYVFRDAWQSGLVFHEADTSTMFYPVFAAFTDALKRGSFLLWTTDLFSGFPLLAEGQTGVLYPPNHLFANLFGARDGFVWLRVFHYAVASIGAYLFGRSMRLSPGAAAVGATSFGFGSFLVGQMQHGSVLASAAWLPLVLALTEWGVRARGMAHQRLLVVAGLVLGMSALGVHIQTVVLSAGCFVGWVMFRSLVPCAEPRPTRSTERVVLARSRARAWLPRRNQAMRVSQRLGLGWTFRVPVLRILWLIDVRATLVRACRAVFRAIVRLACVAWALVVIPVLAVAIAAPQLLPLLELSGFSLRAGGWSYQAATDYSLPVPNLITLVFPFFFRDEHGLAWSLWQPWEVTYYAGLVSLALVVLAVLLGRRRELLFFVPVAAISTLLALGDYSPINLYAELWALPVMNLQRAPARFSLLGTLALAMMAALGAQALWDRLTPRVAGRSGSARLLVVWQGLVIAFVAVVIGTMISWRTWLAAHPLEALAYINQVYLGLRRDPGVVDSAQRVYSGLWSALDPSAWHTALPLLLLCVAFLLTAAWNEMRRLRLVWASLLVLLVAVDLTTFAHDYHPTRQIDDIADVGPVGRYLAEQTRLAGEDVGKDVRVLTDPNVERPKANELLPWSVAEVRAYDPLELSRHRAFIGSATYVNNWLLDLLRVRFLVQPSNGPGLPSFRQVAFHPQHPLVSGSAFNPSGAETWSIGGDAADELRVVTALEDGFSLTDGEVVGEWTVVARDGTETVLPMRAGEHVSDWTYDDPVYAIRPAHHRATVAFAFDLPVPNSAGARHVELSYGSFQLPGSQAIDRVSFRALSPVGRMQVFGFALLDRATGRLGQFYLPARFRSVYEDADDRVLENTSAFPAAFIVPEAVTEPTAETALERMTHGAFQPRRQVVLEDPNVMQAPAAPPATAPNPAIGEPYGRVDILSWTDETRSLRVSSDGGYLVVTEADYPGWQAYVDGVPTEVLRGDYLFQTVPLGPGERVVELRYEPASFWSGLAISRVALGLAVLAILVSFVRLGRGSEHWTRAG